MKIISCVEPLEARIAPAVFIVNTSVDSTGVTGKTSLRDALAAADMLSATNPHDLKNIIEFHIPTSQMTDGVFEIALLGGLLTSTGDVTIIGPGAGKLIISGTGNANLLQISDSGMADRPVIISGITFANGHSTGNNSGGAIYSNQSLTLSGVDIVSNTSANVGGGVAAVGPNFVMRNCVVSGNAAKGGQGGGVYVETTKSSQIINSTISGNSSSTDGGGVELITGAGTDLVSGDMIVDNTSAFSGAGGSGFGSSIHFVGTIFGGNTATASGGGFYVDDHGADGTVSITGCTFENNSGTKGGGIVLGEPIASTISGVTMKGNHATNGRGGGLYIDGPGAMTLVTATVSGSHFDNNTASSNGGGISATGGVSLGISGTTINGNHAYGGGGGVLALGSGVQKVDVKISGGQLSGNFSLGVGGGMYATGGGAVTITGTAISGNSADGALGGGGLCINSSAAVKLAGIIVTDNVAFGNNDGGGVVDTINGSSATLAITGGSFKGNIATNLGGGIAIFGTGKGTVTGPVIEGNIADNGGGIYIDNTGLGVTLTGGVITGNNAATNPNRANI